MNSPILDVNDYKMEYNTIENIPQHIFTNIHLIICLIIGMVIGYFIRTNTYPSIIINNNGNQNIHQPPHHEPLVAHDEPLVAHDEHAVPDEDEHAVPDEDEHAVPDEAVVAHDDEPAVPDEDEPVVLLDANVNNPWTPNEKRELLLAYDNKGNQTIGEVTTLFARQYERECIEQGPAADRRRIPFYGQKCYTKVYSLRRARGDFQVPHRRN